MKGLAAVALLYIVGWVAAWVGFIYLAIHFIRKFW